VNDVLSLLYCAILYPVRAGAGAEADPEIETTSRLSSHGYRISNPHNRIHGDTPCTQYMLHKHVFLDVFHYTLDIRHIPESVPKTAPYDVSTSSHLDAPWTEESRYRHSFSLIFSHFPQKEISGRLENEE
jgi:hypothetical protein